MAEQIRKALVILRRRQTEQRVGLSRTTIYDYIKAGRFPAPVRIGDRAVGWVESEIDDWLSAQVARSRSNAA